MLHEWEKNIEMNLEKVGCKNVDWIHFIHAEFQVIY
jgi:hypothetical protein